MAKLKILQQCVSRASRELHEAITERFQRGLTVHVRDRCNEVIVLDTSWERVKVRNEYTGKEYWVYATRLVEFDKL